MNCSKCSAGNPTRQMEDKLRWLGYERDMIKEEGTEQELFWINEKILKLNRNIMLFRNL